MVSCRVSSLYLFVPPTDELYGELGSDRLNGGNGDDIIIGDIGYALRRYAGVVPIAKTTNSSGGGKVWHKDIVLEEHGNITSITNISKKVNTSMINAEKIASASLLFVGTGYENGTKANASGVWSTDLFTYNLEKAYDDILSGGSGNDILIGQRGHDKLFTGITCVKDFFGSDSLSSLILSEKYLLSKAWAPVWPLVMQEQTPSLRLWTFPGFFKYTDPLWFHPAATMPLILLHTDLCLLVVLTFIRTHYVKLMYKDCQ